MRMLGFGLTICPLNCLLLLLPNSRSIADGAGMWRRSSSASRDAAALSKALQSARGLFCSVLSAVGPAALQRGASWL